MGIFFTSVVSSVLVYLAVSQVIRTLSGPQPHEENTRWLPVILIVSVFCLMTNLFAVEQAGARAVLILAAALAAVYPLSCSVVPATWYKTIVLTIAGFETASTFFCLSSSVWFHMKIPEVLYSYVSSALILLPACLLLSGIFRRIYDIKVVMRAGSVWTNLCLSVDVVYIVVLLFYAICMAVLPSWVSMLLLSSALMALSLRIRNNAIFVLLVNHERRVVESMRLSQSEFVGENPGADQLYDNIYERLLRYFEINKPYLDHDLTINEVVDAMFTNRLYISRAISHCTGRNFCQFVNYHRISYAVELFRGDPQLKIVDLADRSGFNSNTSFNNSFRLYIGEKPSDWCRKERVRLTKK